MMCSKARLDGYTSALVGEGIEANPEYITEGDFTTAGGYAQAISLLRQPNRPTAIFAGSGDLSTRPRGNSDYASPKTFPLWASTTYRPPRC